MAPITGGPRRPYGIDYSGGQDRYTSSASKDRVNFEERGRDMDGDEKQEREFDSASTGLSSRTPMSRDYAKVKSSRSTF